MNLGKIIPYVNSNFNRYTDNRRLRSDKKDLDSSKGVFYDSTDLYGDEVYEFYVNLIFLLDEAMTQNNMEVLSVEQSKLFRQYLDQAGIITPLEMDGTTIEDWDSLTKLVLALDEYLGSYLGDDNGKYTEFREKQFYQERQPFSGKVIDTFRAK
jgi:hypothetical protein